MYRNEFMFLISQRERKPSSPARRTETFTSARSVPFSMSASEIPRSTMVCRSSRRYHVASSAERRSGAETISSNGVPPRLKSTRL
jgi:hypothetical protein